MDIYPTVVELAGLEMPEGVFFDGESLVDALFNDTVTERLIWWMLCLAFVKQSAVYSM